ncbi:MAG: fluoride efflux transporter CrcB [Gammaproteobacteria bacterium]|nr:fluoride efflux transporter CrcB [Gammaproteobacteria bacterium]MCP5137142.1 fluoride efflux transporter CrcB [Gammaproteobacteria bacterium]
MSQLLAIAAGGATGALFRFWVSNAVYAVLGRDFPYGTLAVNVLGSLAMGFLYVMLLERSALEPVWRAFLMVGLLGAFTTFSTFSIETLNLIEAGQVMRAALNMVLSVAASVLAAYVGVLLGRAL